MKKNPGTSFLLPLIIALTLLGCATTKDKQYALTDTLHAYESAIRWGQFDQIGSFHTPQSVLSAALGDVSDVRITSYDIVTQTEAPDGNSLTQTVQIGYYHQADARVRSTRQEQRWVYDQKSARWQIETAPPTFE